jgi:molecular chaperone GrpE
MTEEKQTKSKETISEKVKAAAQKVKDSISKEDIETKVLTPEQEIEELKAKLADAQGDFLRSRADLENYKKRTQEELMLARDRAITSFVQDILPSIDNFEMSLKMTDNKDMFIKGVEMIHANLLTTLKDHKFEDFAPRVGDKFDVKSHDPILIEDDSAEEGKVLAIIQKGFKRGDNVIRSARVQIKKPADSE